MSSIVLTRGSLVLAVLLAAPFLAVFDGFALNVALPSIQHDLGTSVAVLQLAVAGYAVSYAACLLTAGRLGDAFGRRALFVGGLTLFSLASLAGAVAPNQLVLIAARVLQGAAAAVAYPQTLALIRANFTGRDFTRVLTIFAATIGLASLAAQLLSGLLIEADVGHLGWRSILMVNVPIGLIASATALLVVPESTSSRLASFDLSGSALGAITLASLVAPLVIGREFGWPLWAWLMLAVSAVALVMLLRHELHLGRAGGLSLIASELLKDRFFLLGLTATLLLYSAQVSFFFQMTVYLQNGLRLRPFAASLILAPQAFGFIIAALLARRLQSQPRRHLAMAGAGVLVVSMLWLVRLVLNTTAGSDPTPLALAMLLTGMGFGLVIPSLLEVILPAIPIAHAGSGSGVVVTVQQVAGAIGIALLGLLLFTLRPFAVAVAVSLGCEAALFGLAGLAVRMMDRGSPYGR